MRYQFKMADRAKGGNTIKRKYGAAHFSKIGKKGRKKQLAAKKK